MRAAAPTTPATGSAYSPYAAAPPTTPSATPVVEAHRHGYNNREIAELTATIEQPS